jgi:uncharacterized alpha-E superfamily protein
MLSRIAEAFYGMGREIERAQSVTRVLEVTWKMGRARGRLGGAESWHAVAEAFEAGLEEPSEEAVRALLLLDPQHPFSVLRCIRAARGHGRGVRERLSEELWEHLNRGYLELEARSLESGWRSGSSELNRRIASFCDAFHGIADDTLIHGDEWHFLRAGKYLERVESVARILDVRHRSLVLRPEEEGRPIDFHEWQGLLRSLSAHEPYRRAYDARIVPARALAFVLSHASFPRSAAFCLDRLAEAIAAVSSDLPAQRELAREIRELAGELGDPAREGGPLETELSRTVATLRTRARGLHEALGRAFFHVRHRALETSMVPLGEMAEAPQ